MFNEYSAATYLDYMTFPEIGLDTNKGEKCLLETKLRNIIIVEARLLYGNRVLP